MPNRVGRPRSEKRTRTISIAITDDESAYLEKQGNVSEFIRGLIDERIALSASSESDLKVSTLAHRIERLKIERDSLIIELNRFINSDDNWDCWVHDSVDKLHPKWLDEPDEAKRLIDPRGKWVRIPAEPSESGQVAWRLLREYINRIAKINAQIDSATIKILSDN